MDHFDIMIDMKSAFLSLSPLSSLAFGEDVDAIGGVEQATRHEDNIATHLCGKMPMLAKALAEHEAKNDKVLLFSTSVRTLKILEMFLKAKGYGGTCTRSCKMIMYHCLSRCFVLTFYMLSFSCVIHTVRSVVHSALSRWFNEHEKATKAVRSV